MKCEGCGQEITEEIIDLSGIKKTFRIGCICADIKRKAEHKQAEERVFAWRENHCGLKTRQKSMTFESFHASESQKNASNAAYRFFKTRDSFILCGGVGSGKTHLACAVANRLIQTVPVTQRDVQCVLRCNMDCITLPVLFTTAVDMLSDLTAAEIADKIGSRTADRIRAMCHLINITEKSMRRTAGIDV